VIDEANGKVPVIAGTGRPSSKMTIELSKWAQDAGADGIVVVLPYYVTPDEKGIHDHIKKITGSVDIGVILYDNTDATKIYVDPALIERMSEDFLNLIGVKENSTDAIYWYSLKPLQGKLTIIPGKGEIPYASFVHMGVPGFTSAIANFCPEISFEVFKAGQERDYGKMWEVLKRLDPYRKFVKKVSAKRKTTSVLGKRFTTNFTYYAVIKTAAELRGLAGGPLRAPLPRLNEEEVKELKNVLIQMGLLE